MEEWNLKLALLLLIAYLLGAIPNGVWIGKRFFHTDIRKAGSGNIGTTNTFRVLGPVAGSAVLVLDLAKGTVATLLPVWFLHVTFANFTFLAHGNSSPPFRSLII